VIYIQITESIYIYWPRDYIGMFLYLKITRSTGPHEEFLVLNVVDCTVTTARETEGIIKGK